MAAGRLSGSFRDPSGYVFTHEGRVLRAIAAESHAGLSELLEKRLLEKFIRARQVVATRFIEAGPLHTALCAEHPGYGHFLEHERLPHLSFPYEWSVSMLADAARLTLDLQIALLGAGFALKDASAYNVQFRNGRPLFIDLGSIHRPRRLDLWFALGQFQRHFLFPLLLARHRGWDLRSYFLANLDGLSPAQVAANFRGLSRWRPAVLLDVTLPALLEGRAARSQARWDSAGKTGGEPRAQLLNLQRLHGKIARLAAGYRPRGAWHDYAATCGYDEEATAAKKRQLHTFLRVSKPATVLDLGCNTGEYSRLAAEAGAQVLATDADHDAIEVLYRGLRAQPAKIHPLVCDLANPPPGIGFQNTERAPFLERYTEAADCVFALALLHHLLVSANLSLGQVRDLLATFTRRWLVLEWVPPEDAQFQRLLQFRENLFTELTLETCLQTFHETFALRARQPLASSGRTLLFFEKRWPLHHPPPAVVAGRHQTALQQP